MEEEEENEESDSRVAPYDEALCIKKNVKLSFFNVIYESRDY